MLEFFLSERAFGKEKVKGLPGSHVLGKLLERGDSEGRFLASDNRLRAGLLTHGHLHGFFGV